MLLLLTVFATGLWLLLTNFANVNNPLRGVYTGDLGLAILLSDVISILRR
jgi:hypothetical protein